MGLHGALTKLLKTGSSFYQERADCFVRNPVIREAWLLLAQDMRQQAQSLESLSEAFWKEFHSSEREIVSTIEKCGFAQEPGAPCDAVPLQDSISKTLCFEEPLILRAFAPLIRRLRLVWTYPALDFYVMVKAHVARLTRLVQTYGSDPVLIQRAVSLLGAFEREVQGPAAVAVKKGGAAEQAAKRRPGARSPGRAGKAARRQAPKVARQPLAGRRAATVQAAKPLLREIRVTRRRAGR